MSLILREQLWQIKKILKRKEMQDICNYLNSGKINIRDKNCNMCNFNAHIVKYTDSNDDSIIIDLK